MKEHHKLKLLLLISSSIYFFTAIAFEDPDTTTPSDTTKILQIVKQPITVHGKSAWVYRIKQPDGTLGLTATKGEQMNIVVENKIDQPSSIHWHGIILPPDQDGVPYVTQLPIMPGGKHTYNFTLVQAGTYWLHSHYRLQEQKLLAAPFIIKDPEENFRGQEVVILLEDFSFKKSIDIYKNLRCKDNQMKMQENDDSEMKDMKGMKHGKMQMNMSNMDINDVEYDAFLANEHTLSDPQIVRVNPGSTVKLRIIDAAASTNFYINLQDLKGKVIAVDGNNIVPYDMTVFALGIAQRVDIIVQIPKGEGSYPILAQVEGSKQQTGIILATPNAKIPEMSETAERSMPAFEYQQELHLQAQNPLIKKNITTSIPMNLDGDMENYVWKINNQIWPYVTPPMIKTGDRVEMVFKNNTHMSHPMHLHGHVFQITNINGKNLSGALRDTILVLPNSTVKIEFDAYNPGIWMIHCHNLYHAASGMMTTLIYKNYPLPNYTKEQQAQMSASNLFTTPQQCMIDSNFNEPDQTNDEKISTGNAP